MMGNDKRDFADLSEKEVEEIIDLLFHEVKLSAGKNKMVSRSDLMKIATSAFDLRIDAALVIVKQMESMFKAQLIKLGYVIKG